MSLLNRRMPWLKSGAAMIMAIAIAVPCLASPKPRSMAKAKGLPAIAEATDSESHAHLSPKSRTSENQTPPSTPGQIEVDEEAAERALERTLIVQGALLLPFGQAEFQPSFGYTRSEVDDLNLVIQQGTETPFLIESDAKRNFLTADLFFRFGLPFDSQIEFGAPYRFIDTEQVAGSSRAIRNTASSNSSGFGDFRLGLAKALLHEGLWWPNLVGRVTWDTDSGETDTRNRLGSGFNELTGSVTATKRQDPLVFLGRVSYTRIFDENRFNPGDQLGFSVGVLLAASPETSLRLILDQTFVDKLKLDGRSIEGTDQVVANLSFGAASIIGHGKFLDISASTGLTDRAPEYSVGITLVVRFDVPGLPL